MAVNSQVFYRDAFLGSIQDSGRALNSIRFPLIIMFNRPINATSQSGFKKLLQAVYCDHGTISTVAQTDSKMMIMFSNDQDAQAAYQDLHGSTIEDHLGFVATFKVRHPMDDLGYDVADHQIYVSIEGLPQHLWIKEVVDQILHPYCALGDLLEETRQRRNLSSYTAFGWSQQRIAIPRRISLKVVGKRPQNVPENYQGNLRKAAVYTLSLQAIGYLCDSATECSCNLENLNVRYESAYDPDNAKCFLTEFLDNKDLLDELNLGVVATTSQQQHGCQKEEMQDMVSAYTGTSMKVHRLNPTQFMILPFDTSGGHDAKKILLDMQFFYLGCVKFTLDQWTPDIAAAEEDLCFRLSVTLSEVPAQLCTPRVMRFILSPYCAVQDGDEQAQIMTTSERYNCSAWTNAPLGVPKRIMAALFTRLPEEFVMPTADLRITQILVHATVTSAAASSAGTWIVHCTPAFTK